MTSTATPTTAPLDPYRLPRWVLPTRYDIELEPDLEAATFTGTVDIALYPIGGTYTSDEADAAAAIQELIKPRVVIPMHYGYATAGDPAHFQTLIGGAAEVRILDPVLQVRYGG